MSQHFRPQPRDLEILTALVQKVRVFSLRQVAAAWWNDDITNARRRLKTLADVGLLIRLEAAARPLPGFTQALVTWEPDAVAPEFDAVSYALQRRWRKRPPRSTTVYVASCRTARLIGGKARGAIRKTAQTTHDLGVSAIWLRFRQHHPEWAEAWRGEDVMAATRVGQKLPDAFIVDGNQEVRWVVEFGGAYSAERVRAFHKDCVTRSLAYQIW